MKIHVKVQNPYPSSHFQSHPVGRIGDFGCSILAPEPYLWRPCLRSTGIYWGIMCQHTHKTYIYTKSAVFPFWGLTVSSSQATPSSFHSSISSYLLNWDFFFLLTCDVQPALWLNNYIWGRTATLRVQIITVFLTPPSLTVLYFDVFTL